MDGEKRLEEKVEKQKGFVRVIVLFFAGCMMCIGAIGFTDAHKTAGKDVITEDKQLSNQFCQIIDKVFETGWVEDDNGKYYYKDGLLSFGWQTVDGDTYYFDENGLMVKNKMVEKNKYVGSDGKLVPLEELAEYEKEGLSDLKKELQKDVGGYRGTWSIYVKNLDTNEYMSIGEEQINSASLIKLYNMATVYDEIEKGNLEKDDGVTRYLHDMITVSDNGAYNHLLSILGEGNLKAGIELVTEFCEENGYDNTGCGGTLSSSETGFPSIWLFTNYTSTADCGHLLENIYRGLLVSEDASEEMLSLLKQQQWRTKIPAGLPEDVICANKTGEYGARQHDAAIVYSDGADYIITVMTDGDGAAISHIQKVSSIVYEYFND